MAAESIPSRLGVEVVHAIGAGLGLAVPIAVGAAAGSLRAGILAAMGALAVTGPVSDGNIRRQARQLAEALTTGCVAVVAASLLGEPGWVAAGGTVLLAGVAAVAGGFSRPAARVAGRFVTILLLARGLGHDVTRDAAHLVIVFGIGGVGAAAIALLVAHARPLGLFRSHAWRLVTTRSDSAPTEVPTRAPSWRWRYRRWRRALGGLAGWNYALRITIGLAAAQLVALCWQPPRASWIALTVGIVVQRNSGARRTFERATGTVAGVVIASVLLLGTPPAWGLVVIVGVLAGLRPLLAARSYALYATVMTPLILLLIEAGQPLDATIMLYRLAHTAIGCLIALTCGAVVGPRRDEATTADTKERPVEIA